MKQALREIRSANTGEDRRADSVQELQGGGALPAVLRGRGQ